MKRVPVCLSLCLLALAVALPAFAQKADSGPPNIVRIIREEVKPGRGAAHAKVEAGWPAAYGKAKWPNGYLGMTSLSGPNEALFIEGYGSFGAMEKNDMDAAKNAALQAELDQLSAQDGELLSGIRTVMAQYRPALSHPTAGDIAKIRYFRITTYRVRPGHEEDFRNAARSVKEVVENAKGDLDWAVYEVNGGMPGPTFLVFAAVKSLADIDGNQGRAQALFGSLGEEWTKRMAKLSSDGYISVEANIYAFAPKMSYVTKEWAAGDPDFWHPKPKPAAPAAKKEAAKKP